jgi:hypothetical protein
MFVLVWLSTMRFSPPFSFFEQAFETDLFAKTLFWIRGLLFLINH